MGSKAPVQPTEDLDRAEHDLAEYGYAVIANDLTQAQCAAMIERFGEQALAEAKLRGETLSLDDPNLRIDMGALLNKGKIWLDCLDVNSKVHKLIDRALTPTVSADNAERNGLKQRFILSSLDGTFKRCEIAKDTGEGKKAHHALMFHIDQSWIPFHTEFPMAVNTFRCLTDYTLENGATMVLPGTHTKPAPEWDKFKGEGAVAIEAPAGSCILMDGRTWHAGGLNTNGELRASASAYYAAPWFRQRWPMAMNLRQDVVDMLSEEQLLLCGFDTMFQSVYGSFAGPNIIEPQFGRNNITTKQKVIGELHL